MWRTPWSSRSAPKSDPTLGPRCGRSNRNLSAQLRTFVQLSQSGRAWPVADRQLRGGKYPPADIRAGLSAPHLRTSIQVRFRRGLGDRGRRLRANMRGERSSVADLKPCGRDAGKAPLFPGAVADHPSSGIHPDNEPFRSGLGRVSGRSARQAGPQRHDRNHCARGQRRAGPYDKQPRDVRREATEYGGCSRGAQSQARQTSFSRELFGSRDSSDRARARGAQHRHRSLSLFTRCKIACGMRQTLGPGLQSRVPGLKDVEEHLAHGRAVG